MNDKVLVSVYCMVYNHEKYIRNALNGFVSQKTDFKYEVIVHDDASTDNSAAIIREYAEKYPEIIKPIYQTVNQRSQRISIMNTFVKPLLHGKYIAVCEGDDYWSSENKLQMMCSFLEQNPDYIACTHNTLRVNSLNDKTNIMFGDAEKDIELKDVVYKGSSAYHTSALFYRAEYLFNRPDYVSAVRGVGDFPFSIYLATSGKIKYFPQVMSVYNLYTGSSWSLKQKNNSEMILNRNLDIIKMLKMAKAQNDEIHAPYFDDSIAYREYQVAKYKKDYKTLINEKYRKFYSEETFIKKIAFKTLALFK